MSAVPQLARIEDLPEREQAIAMRLLAGRPYKRIAIEFTIAVSTVANAAHRIYAKFNVRRRDQLIDLVRQQEEVFKTHVSVQRVLLLQWATIAAMAEAKSIPGSAMFAVTLAELLQDEPPVKKTTNRKPQ